MTGANTDLQRDPADTLASESLAAPADLSLEGKSLELEGRSLELEGRYLENEEALNSALDRVLKATGMDAAVVRLLADGVGAGVVAHKGLSAECIRELEQVWATRCPVDRVAVAGAESAATAASGERPTTSEMLGKMGCRAQICVPIAPRGEPLGALCIFGRHPRALGEKEMDLLAAVADAMVAGIRSAREQRRLREANEQISALLIGAIDGGFEAGFGNPHLVKCWVENECDDVECPAYSSENLRCWQIAGTLCREGAKGRFAKRLASCRECHVFQSSCCQDDITSIGESFNNMVFILRSEATERAARAKQFIERLMSAQEDERKRVARELHDQTSQSLTLLLVSLKTLETAAPEKVRERVADLEELTLQALDEVHHLALELRPNALDELGLAAALREYLKGISGRSNVKMDLQITGPRARLAPAVETALYRIVQESVINVVKHAQARTVVVSLDVQSTAVIIAIRDDGRGFETGCRRRGARPRKGLGLMGMRERAELLGGKLVVASEPGAGTTIRAEIPLAPDLGLLSL